MGRLSLWAVLLLIAALGQAVQRQSTTVVLLRPSAAAQVAADREGTSVTVQVHQVPEASPRMTYNPIGYLAGTDASAGTILISAHLDHLGVGRPVNGNTIYKGANDDAAGTTAVLELAHAA